MKINRLLLPLITLSGFMFFSCSQSVTGEGDADMAQDYKIEDFNEVDAQGIFKLYLIENDSAYVSVQTHRNLIENIALSNVGKTLKIREKLPVDGFETYEVYVYYKHPVESIVLGEKVLLESANTIKTESMEIATRDKARVNLFVVDAKELEINAKDKSEIEMQGEVTELNIKAKDLTSIELKNLKARVLDLDLSNEAAASVNVESEMEGSVSDNSILEYRGNPKKDVDIKDRATIKN